MFTMRVAYNKQNSQWTWTVTIMQMTPSTLRLPGLQRRRYETRRRRRGGRRGRRQSGRLRSGYVHADFLDLLFGVRFGQLILHISCKQKANFDADNAVLAKKKVMAGNVPDGFHRIEHNRCLSAFLIAGCRRSEAICISHGTDGDFL